MVNNQDSEINRFLKKIKTIKSNNDSYLILTIFMKIINFVYQNNNHYNDVDIKEIVRDYKEIIDRICIEKSIELLDIFMEKISKVAYTPIDIQKRFSKNKDFLLKEDYKDKKYIDRIDKINIDEMRDKLSIDYITFVKEIKQIYINLKKYCNKETENLKITTKVLPYKKDNIEFFMNTIENIYTNLIKEYRYEIVLRASSKKNHDKTIEKEIPSLFYNDKLVTKEKEIFHDFIAAKPNEFENMTTFDKLTKMRHYEVSNRLLDVTYDPLLALYFACGNKGDNRLNEIEAIMNSSKFKIENITEIINNKEKNYLGSKIVFIYIVREKYIKNFNSDTVTILSVLSKLKKEDKIILKTIVDFFKTQQKKLISINDCNSLIYKINKGDMYRDEDKKIDINKKISIWLKNKNKKDNRKSKYSLFDIYEIIGNKEKVIHIADKLFGGMFYGKYLLNKISSKDRKVQIEECIRKSGEQDVSISKLLLYFKHNDTMLEIIFKYLNIPELLGNEFYSNLDEEDIKQIHYEMQLTINKNTRVFTINELFNFFVSSCVPELNWQLKQEIPGWYENVLDLDTFTHCYLVKPKMNNPRIIAQSGAFFIYPFENTDIKKSLINNYIYNINNVDEIKKDLDLLNIKETKYMPDDLTVYAEEIREKYENA